MERQIPKLIYRLMFCFILFTPSFLLLDPVKQCSMYSWEVIAFPSISRSRVKSLKEQEVSFCHKCLKIRLQMCVVALLILPDSKDEIRQVFLVLLGRVTCCCHLDMFGHFSDETYFIKETVLCFGSIKLSPWCKFRILVRESRPTNEKFNPRYKGLNRPPGFGHPHKFHAKRGWPKP